MAEYKCINCGETKESEKQCSCPVCGYSMFLSPYDRKSVIVSEIRRYIDKLEIKTVGKHDLILEGIEKASNRFPDYDKLIDFVTKKNKTEEFLGALLYSVEQMTEHYQKPFNKEINVSFELIYRLIETSEDALMSVFQIIGFKGFSNDTRIVFPETKLFYSERKNAYLWFSAEELFEKICSLANKIIRFIKTNNLYGNGYKYRPNKLKLKTDAPDFDWKDALEDRIELISKVLQKDYVVDIFDDGEEQLEEMLGCLWNSIEMIMLSPLMIKNYDYYVKNQAFNESDYYSHLSAILEQRYVEVDSFVGNELFLTDKAEESLFEIYCKIIETDKFGYMVAPGTMLKNIGESERALNNLIGLEEIKETVKKIKAYALSNKGGKDLNIHMCFLGNPGSGKTEVARCIAGILYENGILPTDKLVEVDRSGLVSQYFGATAEKTKNVINKAMGGVLFIDEAYALGNNNDAGSITDYGKEAIDTLVKAMEDHRGEFCVILAGYKNEMLKMLSVNPGFKSRIQFTLDFPNYSRKELQTIAELMAKKRGYTLGEAAMSKILDITDVKRKEPNFANAREIRNILDQVIMCQNIRCIGTDDKELGIIDVNKYILDSKIKLPTSDGEAVKRILTGEEELDRLIGLSEVKRMIKKIKAYAKRNKDDADFNLHMCFCGNPGTGKTEVARILSRILYDAGVLDEAKLVETDGHGLLGRTVGETAPKTKSIIENSMNGVLFIDEAYALSSSNNGTSTANYGDEAIAVLLKEMEDHRGQFCVILAGYKDEMSNLLSTNPGFESRIQFTLEFLDYSREELGKIALAFLAKKKYIIDEDALDRLLDITDYYRKQPNFANARTVRNILDQVIMNQNLRTEDAEDDNNIISDDINDFLSDEGIDLNNPNKGKKTIGFVQ